MGEFLEKLTDFFNAVTGGVERFITRLFGSSNERQIRKIGFLRDKEGNATSVPGSVLERINQLEPDFQKLSEGELKESAHKFRQRLADGETLDDLLPEAFAAARESGKRYLRMRHFDVQLVGGCILHQGTIAEMVTGEGKTLVATLPAFLNALAHRVHVVTVNDYLARRDMEWMGPLHMGLGLTVGAIQSQMDPHQRQAQYACDITYGTNNEFGFDYLRDNMKPTKELQVQGPLDFAIVDEIDNILIDEARTPLIISGPAQDDITKYSKANRVALQLKKDVHFEIKEKEHTCHLNDEGIRAAEEIAGVESFYTTGNMEWPHLIDNSLKAHYLYKRDVNYVVQNGQVIIVDEFTGRLQHGRQWSDGLHQAVEAKEGVRIKEESQTLATITLQNYFKLYKKLCGMTGTAMTEAQEFWKIYKLDVLSVPTNKPLSRVNAPDVIYRSEGEKWNAVVDEIREIHKTGRPILVGTVSIEKSELISSKLDRYGIKHNILNAKHHGREAEIIAQAGRYDAVTISTNMAGRGTDIILGGNPEHMAWDELSREYESRLDVPKSVWDERMETITEREGMATEGRKVADVGGLHVIGTERHDARRIDLQLRGRSGRQGDPGSSRFFLSLEDDLMRIFAGEWVKNILTRLGMQEGEAIESRMVSKRIEGAQKKVEERHFDMRKHLLDYDEVMDEQRKQVYSYRQQILDGVNCRDLIVDMIDKQVDRWTQHFLEPAYRWETVAQWAGQQAGIELDASDIRGMEKDQLSEYLRDEALRQAEDLIKEQMEENLPEDVEDKREWTWLTLSKWANAHYGLNTNERELKKIGRDDLFHYLLQRAEEAIGRHDFSAAEVFLSDDWPRQSLCGWLNQQYGLQISTDELVDLDANEVILLIKEKVDALYLEKEVRFPVSVGMTNFMSQRQGSGDKYDREGLIRWANSRFRSELTLEDFKNQRRPEVEELLTGCSRKFLASGDAFAKVDELLDRAYGEQDGKERSRAEPASLEALTELVEWANQLLATDFDPADFEHLSRNDAHQKLTQEYGQRYRPELCQAERAVILELLDQAWKDHLYYMDHLRAGIGLVGYAQKDPKVEYKREGMKAFDDMWERIGQLATAAIFRLEKQSPEFVGSLWKVTGTVHEDASAAGAAYAQDSGKGQLEPGQHAETVEPIRNRGPRVGRNDPCPCNSGKKFKKCCGANA